MDEPLQDLELELKSLQPRRPSDLWLDCVRHDLGTAAGPTRYATATNLSSWKWFGWRAVGVATALVLVAAAGFVRFRPTAPAALPAQAVAAQLPSASDPTVRRDLYEPVAATNVLYDLQDEGLVKGEGDAPARRLRYRYLDTYTWKNPRSHASIKWSVPRDEIRVLPASYNPN